MRIDAADDAYMEMALEEAALAFREGEIPVGAVVVVDGRVIARAHNEKEQRQDATAHAELLALQRAAGVMKTWNLQDAVLYCTMEPCPMCAGAMLNARIRRLVFAVRDEKSGASGSVIDMLRYPGLNHQAEVQSGIREEESAALLKSFFTDLRRDGRAGRRRSTRNRVGGDEPPHGFESHSLRHLESREESFLIDKKEEK